MPHQNWVTPYGDIVMGSGRRGQWMGNRGCIHEGEAIVRGWATKRWITCALEFRGWRAPMFEPRRWTPLFFHDEALAFAAGHRPCALCRHADYRRYLGSVDEPGADAVDARLHRDRLVGRTKRLHAMPWRDVPPGVFVDLAGTPAVVEHGALRPWHPSTGYADAVERPDRGEATVITPRLHVIALQHGYELAP